VTLSIVGVRVWLRQDTNDLLVSLLMIVLLSPPSERSKWRKYCFRSVCLCVCVCAQRTGQSDQFKTVKAMDFIFDMHVPRDSSDMNP